MGLRSNSTPLSEYSPHLLIEWDYERNSIFPEDISYGSKKGVWWKCGAADDHLWEASPNRRTNSKSGCPFCAGKKVCLSNSLLTKFPKIAAEWDHDKNSIGPGEITGGRNRKVWWLCKKGHSWCVAPLHRTHRSRGCPECHQQRFVKNNPLVETNPELVREWGIKRNVSKIEDFCKGSGKRVWWVCSKCSNSWKASIKSRSCNRNGCPYCSGKKTYKGNSLLFLFPMVSEEWHPAKNNKTPGDYTAFSSVKVWWLCSSCSHEWYAPIHNRTSNKSQCPKCSQGPTSRVGSEWLDVQGIIQREVVIYINNKQFIVDGFDPKTNTVYEFLGDFWHGNPDVYKAKEINPFRKCKFGSLYLETCHKFDALFGAGYKIVYVWEKDYNSDKSYVRAFSGGKV